MAYNIAYHRAAEKYLNNQTDETRRRILAAIEALPDGDVTKLQRREGYRLTVGGFRVLFAYTGKTEITVVKIGPRGDVYKK